MHRRAAANAIVAAPLLVAPPLGARALGAPLLDGWHHARHAAWCHSLTLELVRIVRPELCELLPAVTSASTRQQSAATAILIAQ